MRPFLSLLALASLLASCAAPGPRAEIDDGMYERSDARRHNAKVLSVDGRPVVAMSRIEIEPGTRRLQLASMGAPVQHERSLTLEAKPCVRYFVVAQHGCVGCPEWEPRVWREEPIDGCELAPSAEAGAAAAP